ncbi:unnamed protein product [Prunus brigantina]
MVMLMMNLKIMMKILMGIIKMWMKIMMGIMNEDNDWNYEDNDEDVEEDLIVDVKKRAELKFQFLDSDYEQEKANQEVNIDDRDFDKYVVYEGVESPHKEPGEASTDEYHYNLEDLRSLSEKEQHDEVEGVKKCSARPQYCC